MANNRIPRNYDALLIALGQAIAGARQYGAEIGLKQNDEAALQAVLAELGGTAGDHAATDGPKARQNAAKSAKVAATAALREAENQGRAVVSACVAILKLRLGSQWNAAWHEAGFTEGNLRVPAHPEAILRHLRAYFAKRPEHEVAQLTDTIACTAAGCAAAADAIAAATAASRQSNLEAGQAQQALEQAIQNARNRLTGLRAELKQLMAEDDPRWFVFGFDLPGAVTQPEIPDQLVVTPGVPGTLFADWDDAARADSYRATVLDGDGKPLAERLVTESEAMFADLPSGAAVRVVVTARNEAGESKACEAGESKACEAVGVTVP